MKYRVKELVKKSGMTLESFAESLGYSRQNLTKTLSNNPTINTLERIADALGVEVGELFAPKESDTIVCPKCGSKFKLESNESAE